MRTSTVEADCGTVSTEVGKISFPQSAAAARDFVRRVLNAGNASLPEVVHGSFLADAELVTSELVTNAIRHGNGMTDFHSALCARGLWICVSDGSSRLPRARGRGSSLTVGGYGWRLVQQLCGEVTAFALPGGGKQICALVPFSRQADSAEAD